MKIKTSELSGAALDWAVAAAEGDESVDTNGHSFVPDCEQWSIILKHLPKYSTWKQGGPIIEREKIEIYYSPDVNCGTRKVSPRWYGFINDRRALSGKTPLEAAMRCYVASKLGDEVEVPEELTRKEQG
jgi:hypothetical protein